MDIKNCKLIELQFFDDGVDGNLVIAEGARHVPFDIKRVYFVNNLKSKKAIRGLHAHKRLKQVLFCINGSFELELDDGAKKESIMMVKSYVGVYMGSGVWHKMSNFSADCVILVLASDHYKESDYIRNYQEFIKFVRREKARQPV